MYLGRKWEGETCLLTCRWHGSGWLSSVLSAYSCNRLKTSRLRTASSRYLRFVSGELLLRCANCHSIYFESMKSLRTALSITLNVLVHLLLGIRMAVIFNRCPTPINCAVKFKKWASLQCLQAHCKSQLVRDSKTGALISATLLSFHGTMLDRCRLKQIAIRKKVLRQTTAVRALKGATLSMHFLCVSEVNSVMQGFLHKKSMI